MGEFHIGDQVIVTGLQDELGARGIGLQGTIVKKDRCIVTGRGWYGVEFPEHVPRSIIPYFHYLKGFLSNKRGYYFYPENIEIAPNLDEVNLEALL